MKKYKIAILDDHELFAEGVSNLLSYDADFLPAFICTNSKNLMLYLENETIDYLLLDINLAKENGLDILKKLKNDLPELKIMILSMYQPQDVDIEFNTFIGDAYVLKISGKDVLLDALEHMKNGVKYFDPNIIKKIKAQDFFTTQLQLTKREKEILKLIAQGKSSKEMAKLLFISELTIKTHRKNINEKMGTKGIANLISKSNFNF